VREGDRFAGGAIVQAARDIPRLTVVLLCALLTGCVANRARPPELVLLRLLATGSVAPAASAILLPPIVVGPVTLPGYAERTQILRLATGTTLQALPNARWAEPLTDNLTRVLLQALAARLATARIGSLHGAAERGARQLAIEVTEFIVDADGTATLQAVWRVLADDGRQVLAQGVARHEAPVEGDGAGAVALALSRVLDGFAGELAEVLRASSAHS
jgi:uncharacterized lipoprotein YmbA